MEINTTKLIFDKVNKQKNNKKKTQQIWSLGFSKVHGKRRFKIFSIEYMVEAKNLIYAVYTYKILPITC